MRIPPDFIFLNSSSIELFLSIFFSVMALPNEVFLIFRFECRERVFPLFAKIISDVQYDALRQQIQWDLEGTGAIAFAAVHAAPCQVHGPHDVPFKVAKLMRRYAYPFGLVALNRTPRTVA